MLETGGVGEAASFGFTSKGVADTTCAGAGAWVALGIGVVMGCTGLDGGHTRPKNEGRSLGLSANALPA